MSTTVTVPEMATIAVRRMVMAVASLSRDSPSRIVTTRRGNPIRRATAVAATASGGATTAPSAMAAENGMGRSHHVMSPMLNAETTTSPTDSSPMTFLFALRSTIDMRIAAAYNSGGSTPSRISSGENAMVGVSGTNESSMPATVRVNGVERPNRRARAESATTIATMINRVRARATGRL